MKSSESLLGSECLGFYKDSIAFRSRIRHREWTLNPSFSSKNRESHVIEADDAISGLPSARSAGPARA